MKWAPKASSGGPLSRQPGHYDYQRDFAVPSESCNLFVSARVNRVVHEGS
jgi:hypothetical protein